MVLSSVCDLVALSKIPQSVINYPHQTLDAQNLFTINIKIMATFVYTNIHPNVNSLHYVNGVLLHVVEQRWVDQHLA